MTTFKGYKGFDSHLSCRGFQYEIGKSYHYDGNIHLCSSGFHYCDELGQCFDFYEKYSSRFCEVEAFGDVKKTTEKNCCSDIRIVRELSREEINKHIYGYGYGNGYGDGYGNGYGDGYDYGDGNGNGYGNGYGDDHGDGYGYGYGYGYGNGDGNGYGDGYGDGYIQKILSFAED